jgi:CHASE2 domain-containing sensor protein/tRNA A-37 threonylcarbamoyl transferase component Bud32
MLAQGRCGGNHPWVLHFDTGRIVLGEGSRIAGAGALAFASVASRPQRWVALGVIGVGLLAGGAGLGARSLGALGWIERPSVDARFALRGSRAPSRSVAIVALDTQSYSELPLPPLPRSLDARLVDRLVSAGARVVAFDFSLERPSPSSAGDQALIGALDRAQRAVVSVTAVSRAGPLAPLAGRTPFAATRVRPGVTLLELDPDGVVRRFPANLGGVESFALAAARAADPGVARRAPRGSLIDYPSGPGTVSALSFLDILSGRFSSQAIRGKIVVVGPTAPVLQDVHTSPLGAGMSGPELQADAISTALNGFPLRSASLALTSWLLLALGLLGGISAALVSRVTEALRHEEPFSASDPAPLAILATGALLALGWSLASQLAFDSGTVLDFADGLLVLAICTGASWLLLSILARRRRRNLRRMFAASASDVIEQVLRRTGDPIPGSAAEQIIAGYRIQHEVGRGGMGIVYRARQTHLERDVALKLIRQELADDQIYRERFEQESRMAAAVTHPHVIPVLDAGADEGLLFITMQLIDGVDLAGLLRNAGGTLAPAKAVALISQIAGALDAVHARDLIHRDVKPANILIDVERGRHAYLSDFGIAREFVPASRVTTPGEWLGTVDYLAPEQLEGRNVDRRADIYALGAVTYHCLTGTVPFPRDDARAVIWAHLNAPRPTPSALGRSLPAALDAVIATAMAVDPAGRYSTASEFADAARSATGLPGAEVHAPAPETAAPYPPRAAAQGVSEATPTQASTDGN